MSTQPQLGRAAAVRGESRKRVLFVCIGNSCRSQMAEAFARAYGSDVLVPASAGLAPAIAVAADTVRVMDEKSIDVRHQFPKSWRQLARAEFDLVVNLSGCALPPEIIVPERTWNVPDPIGTSMEEHRRVRDRIETLVMSLILEFRRAGKSQRA